MLNPNAKLNKELFSEHVELRAIRDGYGEGLVIAGEENKNVVALSADLRESTRCEEFAKRFPERFFEVGVAEQNLATIAAGLGVSGKIPFISSYAVFSPGRNWEQIRTTIAYNDANVKIAGHHAGISVGPDGATHQATEDIAIMRAMPNMKIFVPCDAIEAKKATEAAAHIIGPVYLRFAREKTPVVTTDDTPFTPTKAEVFWDPPAGGNKPSVTIAACGTMVYQALLAARELEKEKINAVVLNVHTIKPLDETTLLKYGKQTKAIVTAEEHQINGGLGGAIAELFAKHSPLPIEMVGIHDMFGESGSPADLMKKYGLTAQDIIKAAKKAMKRKK